MARLKRWTTGHAIAAAAVLLIVLAVAFSMPYRLPALPGGAMPSRHVEQVLAAVNGEQKTLMLPYTFRNLPPGTPISISFPVETREPFSVLVKTVYAPDEVAFNGETVSTYGTKGTYPSFLDDPPTTVRVYTFRPDPLGNGENTITVTYDFPHDRAQLPVAPFAISNISGIFRYEFMGLMACFSPRSLSGAHGARARPAVAVRLPPRERAQDAAAARPVLPRRRRLEHRRK